MRGWRTPGLWSMALLEIIVKAMGVEFTGERVIPGQVDADLLNEHLARYAFAARLARGKRVLDAGCGAGYGAAELAASALSVVGADIAAEAVMFAHAHYQRPNLEFEQAACIALPHPDAAFDLVVAFEVIEHLPAWRDFLLEVRRVLAPTGQFIVSTPNKLYYAESRNQAGANPFHAHEFEFDEFRAELSAIFPHISLFLENHVEGVAFRPIPAGTAGATTEVRVDGGEPPPAESHFFVAVCAHRPQTGNPTFVYVPSAANVLRERETHIALLESELRRKDDWLADAQRDLANLDRRHRKLTAELEESNKWAARLDGELAADGARIRELQEELAAGQAAAQAKIIELDAENRTKSEWAQQVNAQLDAKVRELARCVEYLHQAEKTVEERTRWAQGLNAEVEQVRRKLAHLEASRWVRLGRRVGLGPGADPR
ncbi:MAG TPA: methyltransferase domain-containing protein [Bryobacteraceae bacterium]|nr:methyltransferase domain-containing protein [Bryobacteraceae bacterium]